MKIIRCYRIIGVIFSIINFLLFIKFYTEAVEMDAQYQLLWVPLSFIDFPVTVLYFFLNGAGLLPNTSAIITFGIFGTIWWYFVASFFAKKICEKSSK